MVELKGDAGKVKATWESMDESKAENEVDKQKRREKYELAETKYMIDYEWGYKMGFKCEAKVEKAHEILKTLGYTDKDFIEEWRDLSKEELHNKLAKLKEEAFDYE